MGILIAQGIILLATIGILGLNVKIYTEYVKDRAQDRRTKG